jgi:hypothetical protein
MHSFPSLTATALAPAANGEATPAPPVPAPTRKALAWHDPLSLLLLVAAAALLRALGVLLPAAAMLIIGPKEWWIFVISTGFLLAIWSSLWLVLGGAWVRAAAFPLLFLAWMAGMPGPL